MELKNANSKILKDTIKDILENEVKDAEMLYRCRMSLRQGASILDMQNEKQVIHQEQILSG